MAAAFANGLAAAPNSARSQISLDGAWQFQRDKSASNDWKAIVLPSSFQSHEGTNFHGAGWYRRSAGPFEVAPGKRLLLQFQAAATEASVWWNGERLGTHLGGWTPFRFDVTELARRNRGKPHELRVRLDEKVGHNTQGFLPIIAPHFGGIWQPVTLLTVPETYVDDLGLMAMGDPATGTLRLEIPLAGTDVEAVSAVSLRLRKRGDRDWSELKPEVEASHGRLRATARVPAAKAWSPADPNLYEVEIALPGRNGDRVVALAAFRSITAAGGELRLNGRPLNVRGILNWGYSAPLLEPNPGEAVWRKELAFAKASGFNLMKFCLWIPPQRYLELADEMGMLTWMEYPTWHPTFTEEFRKPLEQEFREFFQYDRNHPSVVLRSLTCETGPSAQLTVIRNLYDEAHRMIPGALVEDDSSWIQWNRVSDFYDDHPYGNNHTWVKTLTGLNEYIKAHGIKPLVLGESISADTWVDREAALRMLGRDRPWWAPAAIDEMVRWEEQMRNLAGPEGLAELETDSLRYGLLMRKYQVETYRREVPSGGYVVSVLRDIPKASMGLLDYEGRPKWSSADWQWHRETICLLRTDGDRRSFDSGEILRGQVLLSHFGSADLAGGNLRVTLEELDPAADTNAPARVLQALTRANISLRSGVLAKLADLEWPLPATKAPRHLLIRAVLDGHTLRCENSWPIWVLPPGPPATDQVLVDASLDPAIATELFPSCRRFDGGPSAGIVVAAHFDPALARFVESGGRVLLLPDGRRNSFSLSAHWFLRGGPYIPKSAFSRTVPHDLFVELQHFDLAGEVVPDLPQLDSFDPVLLLWDTHDQSRVKTHGLIFETRIGRGRLLVSALRHTGRSNSAGRWLLALLLQHLGSDSAPRHALPAEVWDYAKSRMSAEQTNLVGRTWLFKPDPQNEGLRQGWHQPSLRSGTGWTEIKIGAWWESQGYPTLDGWAWYRLQVEIPERWRGHEVFLSFEGVDDIYELYVNGELAGKGGDLETHRDALNEKKSHNITRLVQPGQPALITVRVYDWYGAGGIFRPVTLGTLAIRPELDLLR